jgi:2-keto-4-pentenoate hydratase/2-oxohepta-3-ene-1,7-dioic acid hydratase in catechol pathway
MKLASFAVNGRASFGLIESDAIIDLGASMGIATLRNAIASGKLGAAAHAARGRRPDFGLGEVTLLPPIPDPDKVICIGLNYRAHAAEAGLKLPEHPSVFYEGELAVIIGKAGRHIGRHEALNHVFGYACFNDGSLRDFQFKHSLTVGKNFVATGGFGPWIASADVIPDPSRLALTTRVNGIEVQHKGIDDMIFDVPAIIAYVSGWTALVPGDVIATGTPEGVGFARKPPLWLKPGDTVEIEISDIGVLRNPVVAE